LTRLDACGLLAPRLWQPKWKPTLGDLGSVDGRERALNYRTDCRDWRQIYALLELFAATGQRDVLKLARRVADNLIEQQAASGMFPRPGRKYARTGDEIPLALLHLAATIEGKQDQMPAPAFDRRFFHCEYHGELAENQQKRADKRTYDSLVHYGE
jgi:hypothetical protein